MTNNNIHLGLVSEDNGTNDFLYAYSEFGIRPSKMMVYTDYHFVQFSQIINAYPLTVINTVTEFTIEEGGVYNIRYFSLLSDKIYINYLVLNDGDPDNSEVTGLTFLFKNEDTDLVNTILENLSPIEIQVVDEDGVEYQNMLTFEDGVISLEKFTISDADHSNIAYFYNKETIDTTNHTIHDINHVRKGITIIDGERGVGKTNLIKYLADNIDKKIIHVPSQIIDIFDSLDIHKFLKHNTDSVIIIDDFDIELYQGTKIMNSIVQLVDGFKSDVYNIQFVICTNSVTDYTILESANNLMGVIVVNDLTDAKSKALYKHLKTKYIVGENKLVNIIKGTQGIAVKKIGY